MNRIYIISLLAFLSIAGCDSLFGEKTKSYTIAVSPSPAEGGTVSPVNGTYKDGEVVTLIATPNNGWRFVRWEGDWSSTQNPTQITLLKNYSIIGVFEKRNYPLNITVEGEGTVQERVVSAKSTEYPFQTVVELTPIPAMGWEFANWGGDLSGNQNPQTISVTGEKNVTARFQRKSYPLNITIVGQGQVEEKVVPSKTYPFQTVVELTPVPSVGWKFSAWSGDLSGTTVPGKVTVTDTKNVTATFLPITFLAENGVTIKCPNGKAGEKGLVNGIEYEVVDHNLLIQRLNEGRDLTKVCTSLITDMSNLFRNKNFNQAIGNWDVSNVTTMESMFMDNLHFDQPIGNWDLSNMKLLRGMFNGSIFNQPIGNWNVSNVTNMSNMFRFSSGFNQPIGNWNVSNVESMSGMFGNSRFNQNISKWCVFKIKTEPEIFSTSSPLALQNKPVWGTCPTNPPATSYNWVKLFEKDGFFQGAAFNSYTFDRERRIIYGINVDASRILAFNIDDFSMNTLATINPNIANSNFRSFIFNPNRNTIQMWVAGPSNLFEVSVNGGNLNQIVNGSNSSSHFNASHVYNGVSKQAVTMFGYGLYRVNNSIYEVSGNQWVLKRPDSSIEPYRRAQSAAFPNHDYSKVYIIDGYGNRNGSQLESNCSISGGLNWASDVGKWCWIRDIWEHDFITGVSKNILPVNSNFSVTGRFGYDYDTGTFYSFGGFIPPTTYNQEVSWSNTLKRFNPTTDNGWVTVNQYGDIPPTGKRYQTYYDSIKKRFFLINNDGIWILNL
jgi:surface protein